VALVFLFVDILAISLVAAFGGVGGGGGGGL